MANYSEMPATWKDGLSVGNELIDSQHRAFFDEIAAVGRALEDGEGRDAVIAFYCKFVGALAQHFQAEEALLEQVGFPHLTEHRIEHEALMQAVNAVEGLLVTGESAHDMKFVIKRLFTSLIEHLVYEDMRYKSHLMASMGH